MFPEIATPQLATIIAWGAFSASWIAAAFWADPAVKRAGFGNEWSCRAVMIAGFLLMIGVTERLHHETRVGFAPGVEWAFFAIAIAGMAFAWWARVYLGRLWSGAVTRKADHQVVDTGPYALVRHPIYTGIIVGLFASAAQVGTLTALAGAFLFSFAFYMKARVEERFLREQLDSEAYDSYRRRVPMLVPFGPKSA